MQANVRRAAARPAGRGYAPAARGYARRARTIVTTAVIRPSTATTMHPHIQAVSLAVSAPMFAASRWLVEGLSR